MPIYHSQIRLELKDKEGNAKQVHPSVSLHLRGPVMKVSVGLAETFAKEVLDRGEEVPPPKVGLALIDTGATATCIDKSLVQKIGLPVTGKGKIASASASETDVNLYPISIEFVGGAIKITSERAAGVELENQGLALLIGRDVLSHMILFYNGVNGEITLSV